jgi:hypothetical protein
MGKIVRRRTVRRRTVRRETRKQRIGRLNQSRRKGRKTLLNKRNRKRRASKKRRTSKRRSNSKRRSVSRRSNRRNKRRVSRRRIEGGAVRQCPNPHCLESYLGFTDVQAISRAQKCTKLPTCPGFIKPTAKGLALLVNNDDPVAAVEVAHAYGDTKAREGLVE